MSLISKKDVKARERALQAIRKRFMKILQMIEKGKPPVISIRKRVLANVYYDPERGILRLGERKLVREFLDQKEAKKFMQTLLMAKIIAEALENDEYPTIRDLYYRGKHSIVYRNLVTGRIEYENTWDEQSESDAVIRDIEVFIDMLREEMLILSKEKGKVVGDMRIRSGDDVIDLSKMGHGAYAIEPTPDFIEFLDVGAEFVLIVEKDAVFQQLHRAGFWKKYKALLITSAGQPDRATRRFVRRLNQELNLPVYVITDSDPYGWYIYSVFKIGSITLSYESERLATPAAKLIGVLPTDIFGTEEILKNEKLFAKALGKRSLPKGFVRKKEPYLTPAERRNYVIRAKPRDVIRAIELVGLDVYAPFKDRVLNLLRATRMSRSEREQLSGKKRHRGYGWFRTPDWIREVGLFFLTLSKLEIEALTARGLKFLMDKYIPEKIQTGDWID